MSVAISLYIMYSFLGKLFHILKSRCVCVLYKLFRVDLNNSASVSVCLWMFRPCVSSPVEISGILYIQKCLVLQSKEFVSARQSIGSDESIPV